MTSQPIVVVSNRGPYSLLDVEGELRAGPAVGGLASALGPMIEADQVTWIAAAHTPSERKAAATGALAAGLHFVDIAEEVYHRYYSEIANSTLWFVHHGMYDRVGGQPFGTRWHHSWDAYRAVNKLFARVTARTAPPGSVVLVQDYHLALVGMFLVRDRPDLAVAHFSHTPFASPSELGVLPRLVVRELLQAMTAYRVCGFHSAAWEEAFRSCSEAPLGPDVRLLAALASSSACQAYADALDNVVQDRRLIVRVDRLDPAKNLVRGFQAFDELLESEPRWREQVVFLALANPSRLSSPEYLSYRRQVEQTVTSVNDRWGTNGWTPIVLTVGDSIERSIAALKRYDVLLVNPTRDGLNLVAKEGPLVNDTDGVLVLSRDAGAWATMSDGVLSVNPFDVFETRVALQRALDMNPRERAARAAMARHGAALFGPDTWLQAQLKALGVPICGLSWPALLGHDRAVSVPTSPSTKQLVR
ncbi:MAG: alpha,alpha-trehalose-phosphate synthase (UDP-forming) [Acidimicrobiales bacterium]